MLLSVSGAVASDESERLIGLVDAERMAVENSFDLRLLDVEAAALDKSQKAKIRDFFPQVAVSYRQNRTVAERDFDNGNHSVQLQVSQPVYDGGRSLIALEIARIDLNLVQERKKQAANQLRFEARQQYLKLQQGLIGVSVAKANLESSAALLRKSEAEYRLGMITALDLSEVRNQHEQKALALRKEQNGYNDALKDFALFLRLPEGQTPRLKFLDLANLTVRELVLKQEEMVQMAWENRPDVRQAKIEKMKAQKQYLITERHYLPTISLTGHYGKTGDKWPPRTLEWGVGVNISFPLFGSNIRSDGSVNRSKGDTQRSVSSGGSADLYNNAAWDEPGLRSSMEVMRSADKAQVLDKQIELKVERLVRDYDDRRKSLELADQSLAVREKRFQIEMKKYAGGETSLTELFEEELKLIQARQGLVRERVEYALSVNQLELELGLEIDALGLIRYTELESADEETIRKSWAPKTKIEIPRPRLE